MAAIAQQWAELEHTQGAGLEVTMATADFGQDDQLTPGSRTDISVH